MRTTARRSVLEACAVFALLLATFGYFEHNPESNGNSRLGLVYAVVEEGRLVIDSFHNRRQTSTGDKALRDGHYYSDKAPGSSLLGIAVYGPIYAGMRALDIAPDRVVLRWILTVLVIGVPSALAGSLLYLLALRVTDDRFPAFLATAGIFLGTMCFPYSALYYGHQLAGALLFAAFFLVHRGRSGGRVASVPFGVALGLLLGLALITENTVAVIVAPIGLYYLFVLHGQPPGRRAAALAACAVAGLLPIAVLLAYNHACFGSPFANGYTFHANRYFRESMSRGLMGIGVPDPKVLFYITMHPSTGILWHSPVLLMVPAGFVLCLRRLRPEALVCAVALFLMLLVNSGYYMWWGGCAFGPRHLIPVLPLLGLPLALAAVRWPRAVLFLTVFSFGQMLVVTASNPQAHDRYVKMIDRLAFFEYSPIYNYCWMELRNGRYAQNLMHAVFAANGFVTLLPLIVLFGAAAFYFQRGGGDPAAEAEPSPPSVKVPQVQAEMDVHRRRGGQCCPDGGAPDAGR